jgi:hypothetical protein
MVVVIIQIIHLPGGLKGEKTKEKSRYSNNDLEANNGTRRPALFVAVG